MASFLELSLSDFISKEEIAGPLLISEPFRMSKGKIDGHLEELKNLGFELDRLNPEVLALRTLPRFVPQAQSREITQALLNYFTQTRVKEYSSAELKSFVANNWESTALPSESLLEKILATTREGLVQLTEQNIRGLLK